jgi:hypothetical protein
MKTLVNKHNPRIRITAPEIEEITSLGYTNYEIEQEGTLPLFFNPKEWTLVEEEFPKIISDEKMKQMGEEISKAAVANIKEQFSKVIKEYIENRNDGTYTFVNTEEEPVDLEKEIEKKWNECDSIDEGMGAEYANIVIEQFDEICKYFYELGRKGGNK